MARHATLAGFSFVVVLMSWAGGARSEPDDREANRRRARQHFLDGRKAFEEKRYPAALKEFQAGYELEPRARFLLDMGLVARKMGDLEKARAFYQEFLRVESSDDGDRRSAEKFIRQIDRTMGRKAGRGAAPDPATGSPEDDSEPSSDAVEAPPEPEASETPRVPLPLEPLSEEPAILAPVVQPSESPDEDKPSHTRTWLWVTIGAVLVGAATIFVFRAASSGSDAHSSGSWGEVRL